MISPAQVTAALADWARTTLPALQADYDYLPSQKQAKLPDVIVELDQMELEIDSAEFPLSELQQVWICVFRSTLSIMVDNSDPAAADTQLKGFAATLLAEALGNPTLGERVPQRSPRISFDFTSPLVEYDSGTRGREMTMQIAVADLAEVAE